MTLDEFVDKQKKMIEDFKSNWLMNQSREGKDIYPEEMDLADWTENLDFYYDDH